MNKPLLIAALALLAGQASAQNTAAFVDPYDDLVAFEKGLFNKVEGQRPQVYTVAGDQIGYVAYNGDLKVRLNGTTTTLERTEGLKPVVTAHLIAYDNQGFLKVWDGKQLRTVCTATESFLCEDSLVAFYDGVRRLLNVFYNGEVIQLEDALANDPVNTWKASDNLLAWVTEIEKKFKVFYQGGIYELVDLVQRAEFQVGTDIVAYEDVSDHGFKAFHRGEVHDVEPFMPKNYKCGSGLVAYVDQSNVFKVFQNGKVYTVMDFVPTSYEVVDSLVIVRDNNHLLLFKDGQTHPLTQFIPEQWSASWGTFAYLDNINNVVVWKDGRSSVAIRGGPFDKLTLDRGVVLTTRGNVTRVWWNGEVYSY